MTRLTRLKTVATPRQIAVFREGEETPLLVQHAEPDRRPYLHPLRAPDGPHILTEDAPAHHPWQHGLYVGLNDVNGVGFWKEGGADGTFHPAPLRTPEVAEAARWIVEAEWRAPLTGEAVLRETQQWTLTDGGDTYTLDFSGTLRAVNGPVTFGQSAYGGLFLRMPYHPDRGASVLTSEKVGYPEAEQQRARWVALSMPIEGRDRGPVGIAVFDHPENAEHPTPWRVDKQRGIAPSRCIAGGWALADGETARTRHRLFIFSGEIDAARIEMEWRRFAAETGSPAAETAIP